MIKFSISPRRNPSMSQDEFATDHRDRHGPVFCALPAERQHLRRYVQCRTLPASIPGPQPITFGGITKLWFDDEFGLEAVFSSKNDMQIIRPDEARFLDLHACEFVLPSESTLFGQSPQPSDRDASP